MNKMEEMIEMFRITPELNKCYKYAEYKIKIGKWPNERYYVITLPTYVGKFIRREEGGFGDSSWRRDYFQDENGIETIINYSYEGTTSFREVVCETI